MFHYENFREHLPKFWSQIDPECSEVEVSPYSREYEDIITCLGNDFIDSYNISRITRVQNPYLYLQFLLKKEECSIYASTSTLQLYHCTSEDRVDSIVTHNLDWRLANRVKFGQGVSFSPSPIYAHNRSNKKNGNKRAMLVVDVIVGSIESVHGSALLPKSNCDTTCDTMYNTFVKYYDNEYYPNYVVYYQTIPSQK